MATGKDGRLVDGSTARDEMGVACVRRYPGGGRRIVVRKLAKLAERREI